MATILFYAGPDDNAELKEKICSLGLRVYAGYFERPGVLNEAEADQYHGSVSFQAPNELHPYPGPKHDFPYRISSVTDPLIDWMPSYTTLHKGDRYLIHGRLIWDFEDTSRNDELVTGKRLFGQLSRWIRKNWPPPAKGWVCRGPHAQRMIQFESYIPRGLPPDIEIQYIRT